MSKTDKPFRPMLAETCDDIEALSFPLFASPKLDGVRMLIRDGIAVTRSLKPVPNKHLQELAAGLPDGLDGEIIFGDPTAPDAFTKTQSIVMAHDKSADGLTFHIFDDWSLGHQGFLLRHTAVAVQMERLRTLCKLPVAHVPHDYLETIEQLIRFEQKCVDQGWEGAMLRSPHGPYKTGRSTVNEAFLLKLKRFLDDDGEIIGCTEQMSNQNEATKDRRGHTERSSKKSGLVPMGTLGAVEVRWRDTTFEIGTGFDAKLRADLWAKRDELPGRFVKFKYQGIGSQGRPRFPVWIDLRSPLDLGPSEPGTVAHNAQPISMSATPEKVRSVAQPTAEDLFSR